MYQSQSGGDFVNTELIEFRACLDSDKGFQSKRKLLVVVCIIFLAINLTGATIEEANTFLFKIKFSNHIGLSYLFVAAISYLTIRYYAYAQDHHSKLYNYWSARLLANYKLFYYDHRHEEIGGMLGKAINVYGGDEPGIQNSKYCTKGIFGRTISYQSEGTDEEVGEYSYTKHIDLTKFNEQWKPYHYLLLLWLEFKCQLEATIKYRESLDLLAPYLLSLVAILSFIFKSSTLLLLHQGT
jgi:hypothetical protein